MSEPVGAQREAVDAVEALRAPRCARKAMGAWRGSGRRGGGSDIVARHCAETCFYATVPLCSCAFARPLGRLQISLTATRWDGGRVRHEHIAGLGSVPLSPSATDGIAFWIKLHQRLGALSNRVDATQRGAILTAIHARSGFP